MRLRKGPVIAALYPVGMLLVQLVVAVLTAWVLAFVIGGLGSPAAAVSGAVVRPLSSRWRWRWGWSVRSRFCAGSRRRDGKLFAYYLMHDYAYSARLQGRQSARVGGADGRVRR